MEKRNLVRGIAAVLWVRHVCANGNHDEGEKKNLVVPHREWEMHPNGDNMSSQSNQKKSSVPASYILLELAGDRV